MKVKDIKSKLIRELAESYKDDSAISNNYEKLKSYFTWYETKEGADFWEDVYKGYSEQELREKYPDLEIWKEPILKKGEEVQWVPTDKQHTTLAEGVLQGLETANKKLKGLKELHDLQKEREDLKEKLKEIEDFCTAKSVNEPFSKEWDQILDTFFTPKATQLAKELLDSQDEETKKAMFELLKKEVGDE